MLDQIMQTQIRRRGNAASDQGQHYLLTVIQQHIVQFYGKYGKELIFRANTVYQMFVGQ